MQHQRHVSSPQPSSSRCCHIVHVATALWPPSTSVYRWVTFYSCHSMNPCRTHKFAIAKVLLHWLLAYIANIFVCVFAINMHKCYIQARFILTSLVSCFSSIFHNIIPMCLLFNGMQWASVYSMYICSKSGL